MKTPRTDEEYAKTLNSDYEYVGAEDEAWHWARKLERELAEPLTILPPLPKKEILKAPERREIRGYTAAQMMDYADAAISATWKAH